MDKDTQIMPNSEIVMQLNKYLNDKKLTRYVTNRSESSLHIKYTFMQGKCLGCLMITPLVVSGSQLVTTTFTIDKDVPLHNDDNLTLCSKINTLALLMQAWIEARELQKVGEMPVQPVSQHTD